MGNTTATPSKILLIKDLTLNRNLEGEALVNYCRSYVNEPEMRVSQTEWIAAILTLLEQGREVNMEASEDEVDALFTD